MPQPSSPRSPSSMLGGRSVRPSTVVFLLVGLAALVALPRLGWGGSQDDAARRERPVQKEVDFRPMPMQPGTPVLQIAYLQMSAGDDDHAILDADQVVLREGVTQRVTIAFSTADGAFPRQQFSSVVPQVNAPRVVVGDRFGGIAKSMELEVDYRGFHEERHVFALEGNGRETRWGPGFRSGGTSNLQLGMRALEWGRATPVVDLHAGGALLLAIVDGATASSPGKFDTWLGYFRAGADVDLAPDRAAISAALEASVEDWKWHLDRSGDLGPALDAATGAFLLGDRATFDAVRDRVNADPSVLQRIADQHRSNMAEYRQGRWLRQLASMMGHRGTDLKMSGTRDHPERIGNFGLAVRALRWAENPDAAQWASSLAGESLDSLGVPWVIETRSLGESDLVESEWLAVRAKALSRLPRAARLWASSPVYLWIWLLAPIVVGLAFVFARTAAPARGRRLVPPRRSSLFVMFLLCLVTVNEIPLLWLALPILWRLAIRLLRTGVSSVDRVALATAVLVPTCTLLATVAAYPALNLFDGLAGMGGLFGVALIGLALEREGWSSLRLLLAAILLGGAGYALGVLPEYEGLGLAMVIGSLALTLAFLVQTRPPESEPAVARQPLPSA